MKRFALLSSLCILGASLLLSSPGQDPRQIEEERSRPEGQAALQIKVNQVRVDVTVRNRDGNLITGLTQENFKVYEDNVQQEITYFEPVEAPMTVVLITEYNSTLPWEWLYEALIASYTFVDRMRQGDWVAVVAYDMRPEILVDFTQNKHEVYQALRRLNFPAFRESNLFDTLKDTLTRVEEIDSKVAIVLLATGRDTFSKINLGEALDVVRKSDVVIYPVSLGGNLRARADHRMGTMTRMDFHQADNVLRTIAKYTGGEAFFPRFETQFPGIFETISHLLRNQYALGYVSTNPARDGKYRKLKVEVTADISGDGKPDRLKVNHREGYLSSETM
jgi:Ca-activated chloride channel homolog